LKFLTKDDAELFLKLVFYISLPALIILSIAKIEITTDFLYLPIIPVFVIFSTFIISSFVGKLFDLPRKTFGVYLIGTLIMNIGFTLPFFIAAYGNEGLARASMFDFGNGLLTLTFVYFLACKYGNDKVHKTMIKKFALLPPIWALLIGIILNFTNIAIPSVANNFLQIVGDLTIPLIMLSLGIYFTPKIIKLLPLSSAIITRMGLGLLLGFLLVKLFNLDGLNRLIVLIGSAAPVGYNTLVFASLESLDKEFAASLVSISILLGIIFIPLLIMFL
jgi:hypothetical protein